MLFYIRPIETLLMLGRESIELIKKTAQKGSNAVLAASPPPAAAEDRARRRPYLSLSRFFFSPIG
jgi:formate dehydrogenase assembly factor FdhD